MSGNSNENLSSEANIEPAADQSQSQSSITTTASIASSSPATSLQSLSLATSIDEKNEKLKIILDNPDNTYYSGQTIRGTITLNCKQKKKIRGELNKAPVSFGRFILLILCVHMSSIWVWLENDVFLCACQKENTNIKLSGIGSEIFASANNISNNKKMKCLFNVFCFFSPSLFVS